MKKLIVGALVAAVASVALFGATQAPSAQAAPSSVLLLRSLTVNILLGPAPCGAAWDFAATTDNFTFNAGTDTWTCSVTNPAPPPATLPASDGIADGQQFMLAAAITETGLTAAELDARDGSVDGVIRLLPSDFAALDLDANQLIAGSGSVMWVLAFVTNDENVTFVTDTGTFAENGLSTVTCGVDFPDADCDNNGTVGDGVAVASLTAAPAARREAPYQVHVTQGLVTVDASFTVTGTVDNIDLTTFPATKSVIQTGGDDSGTGACQVSKLASSSGLPEYVGLLARVNDPWGTAIAGWPVAWLVSDRSIAQTATDPFPVSPDITVSLQTALGVFAPNLLCGRSSAGVVDVVARSNFSPTWPNDSIGITVVGAPANVALAAAPSSLICNGTNSSVVTATVTDSSGNPVAEGNDVTFSVVALGNANPIIASTGAGGIATSTVTPLAGVTSGVVVNVFVGSSVAQSIRIDCTQPAPTAVPAGGEAGAGGTPTGITPPNTGTGGYSDGGSFSWLALAGLLGAASVLFVGGLSLRRARR